MVVSRIGAIVKIENLKIFLRCWCLSLAVAVPATGQTGTLVVANMSDATATVIDIESGDVVATLPTGIGPHEVAVSHDGRTAVVTNYGNSDGAGNSLTVIDVLTATVSYTVDLGDHRRPHGSAFLPGDEIVAITSETSQAVLLVNLEERMVVRTIPTDQRVSHMLSMVSDGSRIYTTNIVDGTISELNVASGENLRVLPVAAFVEGIGVNPNGTEVWVGSNRDRTVSVVDVASGEVTHLFEGFGFPYRIAWTNDQATAVISDPARGEIRVIDASSRQEETIVIPAQNIVETAEFPNSPAPEGIAITPGGRWVYVTLQGRNEVGELDLVTGDIVRTMPTGVWPDGIGYSALTR